MTKPQKSIFRNIYTYILYALIIFVVGSRVFFLFIDDQSAFKIWFKKSFIAIEYYSWSADGGNVESQVELGNIYISGPFKDRKYDLAFKYYSLAAAQNDAHGLAQLGQLYDSGDGVSKNQIKAVELFSQAAEQKNSKALYNLARAYRSGRGVPIDHVKSLMYYKLGKNYSRDAYVISFYTNQENKLAFDMTGNEKKQADDMFIKWRSEHR